MQCNSNVQIMQFVCDTQVKEEKKKLDFIHETLSPHWSCDEHTYTSILQFAQCLSSFMSSLVYQLQRE